MLRTVGDQATLWESLLPAEALVMPAELVRVDALLDDGRFFAPYGEFFHATLGRPSIPIETYLRLMGQHPSHVANRAHFFAVASELMRRILVDHARSRLYQKRGGGAERLSIDDVHGMSVTRGTDLVAIDDALQELAFRNAPCAELVKLRFFTGLTLDEAAAAMGIARRTANRYWAFARAWLFDALRPE